MTRKQKTGTKEMLAGSLKTLMSDHMCFDKITIKDITNQAGLIRPTFYNHFQDKYELLEWIFYEDIVSPSYVLVDTDMIDEALRLILVRIRSEKDFLTQAYRVTGQNAFEQMVFSSFLKWIRYIFEMQGKPDGARLPMCAKPEHLSYIFANTMAFLVKLWNDDQYSTTVDEMTREIDYLSKHTFAEFILGSG